MSSPPCTTYTKARFLSCSHPMNWPPRLPAGRALISNGYEAVRIAPLTNLLLECLALVHENLPVVSQRNLEPFERPWRRALEIDPRDIKPATVARALEF